MNQAKLYIVSADEVEVDPASTILAGYIYMLLGFQSPCIIREL